MDMTQSSLVHGQQQKAPVPAYRRFYLAVLAACIVLAPLTLAAWFQLCPTNDVGCPDQGSSVAVYAAFRATPPVVMRVFLLLSVAAPYLYPLSYFGLGLLALRRSPWLAITGMICGWLGSVTWGLIANQMFMLNSMARLNHDSLFMALEKQYYASGEVLVFAIGWVLGHTLAYVLLGIALWRARVVPRWAATLLIVSAPLMGPIAYGTNLSLLQVAGYALAFIGSVPAAAALLRGADEAGAIVNRLNGPQASSHDIAR